MNNIFLLYIIFFRPTFFPIRQVLESNLTTGPDEYLGDSVGLLEIISLINKHSGVKVSPKGDVNVLCNPMKDNDNSRKTVSCIYF